MAGSSEGRMDVPELRSGNKMVPEGLRVRPGFGRMGLASGLPASIGSEFALLSAFDYDLRVKGNQACGAPVVIPKTRTHLGFAETVRPR